MSGLDALDLDATGAIAVALSGGSDSTALLVLLQDHMARSGRPKRLVALTVDHGLRPDSAAEARMVAAFCAARGVDHRILRWRGAKPASGVAAAARLARHLLLADAAGAAGAGLVVTGHTADDQAETVAMRQARGPGPGLAGIAAATLFGERMWFARPLLGERRSALRDFLSKAGIGWIDDPSNEDQRLERPRVRRALAGGGAALIDLAREASAARRALSARVAAVFDASRVEAPGLVRVVDTGDREAVVDAVRLAMATLGGRPRPPALAATARVMAGAGRFALAGAVASPDGDGLLIHREWRGTGPRPVAARTGALFDGRFLVTSGVQGGMVRARGEAGDTAGGVLAGAAARAEPVAPASAALRRVIAPAALFLPEFDLEAMQALARLLGLAPFPAPPLRKTA